MHIDSHRLRFNPEDNRVINFQRQSIPRMPCPKRFAAALQETTTTEDGVKMYTWRAVRRQHLHLLRKQTRSIVFFMALLEVLRVGAGDIVYQGRHGTTAPGLEDYGIAYNVGYFMGWLWMCLFAVLYVPLFGWWLPKLLHSDIPEGDSPSSPSTGDHFQSALEKMNAILIPTCIGIAIVHHIYYAVCTFIYVDARPVDATVKLAQKLNTRRHWAVRGLMFVGILVTMALGKGAFVILEQFDLARVKPLEYVLIVLPIQINLGILLGSAIQVKAEQRSIRKAAAFKDIDTENAAVEEKQALLATA